MTSQPGYQTIAIHILPNNTGSKSNQTKEFCQLREYNRINIFYKNYAENGAGRPVSDLFLHFYKSVM